MPAIHHNPRQRKTVTLKPKSWTHQDDLSRGVGKKITIHTACDIIEGVNIAADQFSVKVRVKSPAEEKSHEIVVFKSAIRYFEVIA